MKLKLIQKEPREGDVISFVFEPPEGFSWRPGQYMHVTLPHPNPDDRGIERWFTIAAPPFEGHPRITTRIFKDHPSSFKQALAALNPGDTIEVDEPEGDFVLGGESEQYVFIAGGIGFTPFHAILSELERAGKMPNITILYGSRTDDPVFHQELERMSQTYPQLKLHYIVDPQRIDGEVVRRYVDDLQTPLFYVSGPEPMVDAFEGMLKELGVPKDHIRLDHFPGYSKEG